MRVMPAEVTTFVTVFAAVGLISVAGALLARHVGKRLARRRGEAWEATDRLVLVSSGIVGVVIGAAIALIAVLVTRPAH